MKPQFKRRVRFENMTLDLWEEIKQLRKQNDELRDKLSKSIEDEEKARQSAIFWQNETARYRKKYEDATT